MSFPASKSSMKRVRKSRMKKELKSVKPQMTSLIDLMTVIIIFLLQSFSTEGQIISVSNDLALPNRRPKKRLNLMSISLWTNKYIMAENEKLVNIDEVLSNDELVVPQLYDWLGERRKLTEQIAKYSTKTTFKGNVTIQGDKRIHFRFAEKDHVYLRPAGL